MASSVDWSAQCRSSIPNTTGRVALSRFSSPKAISSNWAFCMSAPASPPALSTSVPAMPAAGAGSGSGRARPSAGPRSTASDAISP